jgi:hypothetical protein
LTSLYAVLTGRPVLTKTFEEKRIRIAFRPLDETFEVTDAAIERSPEFIPDITALWGSGYKSTLRKFINRLSETRDEPLDHDEEDILEERVDRVRDLRDFRFQVIELAMTASEEQVAEIFVRTNSEGVKLNQADFILTLMSVHWEKGRRQLEEFAREAVDPKVTGSSSKNPFIDPSPDQLLRAGVGLARAGSKRTPEVVDDLRKHGRPTPLGTTRSHAQSSFLRSSFGTTSGCAIRSTGSPAHCRSDRSRRTSQR